MAEEVSRHGPRDPFRSKSEILLGEDDSSLEGGK